MIKTFHVLLSFTASLQQHVGALLVSKPYEQGAEPYEKATGRNVFRQVLDNDDDLQYLANITVGGQLLRGIFDTGSIELVVLSDKCAKWCGESEPLYHATRSTSYKPGSVSLIIADGSGQVSATEAYETVEIGTTARNMTPFWEVQDAEMPLLLASNFAMIVGLGPVPANVTLMRPDHRVDNHGFAVLQKTMSFERFSICLGHDAHSPGYLTWNDPLLFTDPSLFRTLRVAENGYWMVELLDVELGEYKACSSGCGAVIDSGTSLLAMPSANYEDLNYNINAMVNCGNIGSLPDLHFKLDGVGYTLPPDSYVGEVFGDVGSHIAKNFKLIKVAMNETTTCQATLMEINMDSALGDVWILGVPFFRRYYTVFVQATSSEPAAIYTAPASNECYPGKGGAERLWGESRKQQREGQRARRVHASKLRVGPWLQRAQLPGHMQAKDFSELSTQATVS